MPVDMAPAFVANPTAFIAAHCIALNAIGEPWGGGFPAAHNRRNRFTLACGVGPAAPLPADQPMLRMQPDAVAIGAAVGGMSTLDAYYCHAGDGGMAFNNLWRVDIPIAPGPGDARLLFTTGMNGCTLVVASAVPPGAPPLAPGHWRVMHDHDHRTLAAWQAAGYTVRFAAYADSNVGPLGEPGPVPVGWAVVPRSYNPHAYPWHHGAPPSPPRVRVVTNFFWYDGAHWNCGSRHFHASGAQAFDIDAPPGVAPPLSSTQTWQI